MSDLPRVSRETASALIDFAAQSGQGHSPAVTFAASQLDGTVNAYNMIAQNGVAYLADEVGLGKTYVALGVMGLIRHFDPAARIVVLAPRENIQLKWIKELGNFVRNNWQVTDNRVRSIQGTPARDPVACGSLAELILECTSGELSDLFLRFTSFSLATKQAGDRQRYAKHLRERLPWVRRGDLALGSAHGFRDAYGRILNAVLPEIDLLVVDEAHNLKRGFGARVSNRNRILGLALGHPSALDDAAPRTSLGYGPRVKRVLCLSATPFEDDYADLARQLDVLGKYDADLHGPDGQPLGSVRRLGDASVPLERKEELVRSFLIRRIAHLEIAGKRHTKNMYRREWRSGGLTEHDQPLPALDDRQRLVVGLVQKKVAELLGHERFGGQFQIGMLSSFESFLETVETRRRRTARGSLTDPDDGDGDQSEEDDSDSEGSFYGGDQAQDATERRGIDTPALQRIVASYREQFRRSLPHPKLDATATALAPAFETGEKALVFVRRVATVEELARKLSRSFDQWIIDRLRRTLPECGEELDRIVEEYEEERRPDASPRSASEPAWTGKDGLAEHKEPTDSDIRDFFGWFFRGRGPDGWLSGAAFQRNRLSSAGAVYRTFFEDDYVAAVLGTPADVVGSLRLATERGEDEFLEELRGLASGYFRHRTQEIERFRRLYVHEAYQAAGLHLLARSRHEKAEECTIILRERFPDFRAESAPAPEGFPPPDEFLGARTFFTELRKYPELRADLWPDESQGDARERFRRREQRRELLSAQARLGVAYIDLYTLAIREVGSFESKPGAEPTERTYGLVVDFVESLEQQRTLRRRSAKPASEGATEIPTFGAYDELHLASENFDTLLAVNFPEVPTADLSELAEIYGRALQNQSPVGTMRSGVNRRVVRQFRMPGFPYILVTTDVLQEGEDLHTFCHRVIHYGITWTPSAMEQRTGRIDRIGSLVQRRLDGRDELPRPEEKIQVHYPYLPETVEVLQVRRVLHRLDRFLELVHRSAERSGANSSTLDLTREILSQLPPPKQREEELKSAFPVDPAWFEGPECLQSGPAQPDREPLGIDRVGLIRHLDALWNEAVQNLNILQPREAGDAKREGVIAFRDGRPVDASAPSSSRGRTAEPGSIRYQLFRIELRSRAQSDATLVRCTSDVGWVDLHRPKKFDELLEIQRDLGPVRICARKDQNRKRLRVTIERSLLFHPETTQGEELKELIAETAGQADRIEERLFEVDAPVTREDRS